LDKKLFVGRHNGEIPRKEVVEEPKGQEERCLVRSGEVRLIYNTRKKSKAGKEGKE